jgi:hypothetical protein
VIKKKEPSKTHFEQVPLDIVKEIAIREPPKEPTRPERVRREPSSKKTEPYSAIRLSDHV